jgi:TRAP-type C4-dicarboxylate transport system permease large subunit
VTISKVALPEMKRLRYGSGLAFGAVAAGGTLGFLILPSTGFVIYAILAEESIGRLFIAGILLGPLLKSLFIVTAWIISVLDPVAGPRGPVVPFAQKFRLLMQAMPLLAVILLSIAGIYVGVLTPRSRHQASARSSSSC